MKKEFTLIELLVVIAIIAILASIMLPTLSKARETAYQVSCLNNLKQMGVGANMYTGDYNGNWVPIYSNWVSWDSNKSFLETLHIKFVATHFWPQKWICPRATAAIRDQSMKNWGYTGADAEYRPVQGCYAANYANLDVSSGNAAFSMVKVRNPSSKIAFIEGNDWMLNVWGSNPDGYWSNGEVLYAARVAYRHGNQKSTNMTFFDGHVENRRYNDVGYSYLGNWDLAERTTWDPLRK